jgi:hypothetical protein
MTDVILLSFSNYKVDPKSVSTDKKAQLAEDHSKLYNTKARTLFDTDRYSDAAKTAEDKVASTKLRQAANARSTYQDKSIENGKLDNLGKSRISDAMKMSIYNRANRNR